MRVRNRARAGAPLRRPLIGAGRAFRQLPFVAEQVLEEVVAPFRRRRGPDDLEAAGDRVISFAGAEFILPPEALLLDGRAFGFGTDIDLGVSGAVRLAEGMAARDQRDGFFVVHRHALERFTDVLGGGDRIRLAVRPFRIDVDETHLHCAKGMFELAIAKIALVSQPLTLWTPVDGIVGLPAVRAPAAETEGLEAHRFEGDVAGENQKIRPRELPAVFLLDRPQQATRLVEARIVRPAVERRKTLLAISGAAAAVVNAVRARAVPRYPDEQRPIVAKVGRPPILRVGHQGLEVADHRVEVERFEFTGVVEILAHGVDESRIVLQPLEVELFGPPVAVDQRPDRVVLFRVLALAFGAPRDRAFAFVRHVIPPAVRP